MIAALAKNAIAPRTPPTMAPTLVDGPEEEEEEVDDDDDDEGKHETSDPVLTKKFAEVVLKLLAGIAAQSLYHP